ncbi:MAG: hypothetical protein R6U86_00530 [Bacteroidales bacterium]
MPIGDKLLFEEFRYCLNIGGFANVSYDRDGVRMAFDICPVNIECHAYTVPVVRNIGEASYIQAISEFLKQ